MPSVIILSQGKIAIYTFYRERVGNAIDGWSRRRPNESQDKDSPSTKCQIMAFWEGGWTSKGQYNRITRRVNGKFSDCLNVWKGNGNTTTLLFSLEGFEILYQERRREMNTTIMEHFNSILFHKSRPANKQRTYQSINLKPACCFWLSLFTAVCYNR